ncbi:MAG: zf-HC2 domain-containing protein [Acidobacteriaceae bacterium]|nr:zf-HC2 domain-containing protein [Acidobacteriaceae bacterium]
MISCADFLAELSNYVEGDVAEELRAQLELHLSHCRSCTVLVDSTRKTIRILADADCFELPENVCSLISERIVDRIQKGAHRNAWP